MCVFASLLQLIYIPGVHSMNLLSFPCCCLSYFPTSHFPHFPRSTLSSFLLLLLLVVLLTSSYPLVPTFIIHLLPPHFPPKAVPRTHVAKELLTSMDAHKDAATLSNLMSAALRQPMRGHNQVCESIQGWMLLLTHCVWGVGLGVELRMPERTWVVELALSERENIYLVGLRVF